ncbi:hypothetical protein [Paractinoplanes toevensis]|nr:hypothetical protein [Actinoplanes toevensis]
MTKTLTRLAAIAAAAPGLTLTVATPALASADKSKGDAYASCIAVNGKALHVNSINSRVAATAATAPPAPPSADPHGRKAAVGDAARHHRPRAGPARKALPQPP